MFTGLIEEVGRVSRIQPSTGGMTLWVQAPQVAADSRPGDSIAVNGACLTVEEVVGERVGFHVGTETRQRTTADTWRPGTPVNLERPLAVGQRLGGHFVQGHVDCVGHLQQRIAEGESVRMTFSVPPEMMVYIAEKGSIAVDGISLTVTQVTADSFAVAIIPYTLDNTNLGQLAVGSPVNIEVDILAKYVRRSLGQQGGTGTSELTQEFLAEHGFC